MHSTRDLKKVKMRVAARKRRVGGVGVRKVWVEGGGIRGLGSGKLGSGELRLGGVRVEWIGFKGVVVGGWGSWGRVVKVRGLRLGS